MDFKGLIEGKTALITGAARGIGAAAARTLAQQGAVGIAVVDIDQEAAEKTSEEISRETGCRCLGIKANVAVEEEVAAVFSQVRKLLGAPDILVNNAGICKLAGIDDVTMREWDRTLDVNLKGTFLFSREALRMMKLKGSGSIINIASQAGKIGGLIASPDYSASKAGMLCLTKTFAKSGAPFNVRVNSIAPGLIGTEMTQAFGYDSAAVPLGRIGTPEEVADVVLFLASDLSNYITGACIDVNGGMTMW